MLINRRRVMTGAAGAAALLAAPALAAAVPHVVVLGGGAGGAAAALFLKRLCGEAVRVSLIEAERTYHTCFGSNLVLGGLWPMEAIEHGYGRLPDLGVEVIHARASRIDPQAKRIGLEQGGDVAYDRLVAAPGIELLFDAVPGYSQEAAERMPHAWKAGAQTVLLKKRIEAIPDGGSMVIVVPDNPYRCPPGPYERVSMIAHHLKETARSRTRITVLDGKEKFSKQALFQEAWERLYPGMVEWLPPSVHGGLERVDPAENAVVTALDTFSADLVNVIPPQKAGAIAGVSELVAENGWCPVDPATMRSTLQADVWVLGDAASAGDMPKSAFSANSQAKLAAAVIAADILGAAAPDPRYFNTCWSLLAPGEAVKVGGLYAPADGAIKTATGFVSEPGEPEAVRQKAADEVAAWYTAITAEMFGPSPA